MRSEIKIQLLSFGDGTERNRTMELPLDVAHVWKRSLAVPATIVAAQHQLLSREERERASRYRVEPARNDYILTRGALRRLLADYLHKAPQDLTFKMADYGKPFLDWASDISFNVSHTDGLALLAFVREREVGVDVERIRPEPDAKKLAERFFSNREREALKSLDGVELYAAFFRCWTRKEAYIKARGEGLSLPLDGFDVSINANESHALLSTRPDAAEANRWILGDLAVGHEYAAALAVAKP
jgi:4'-phosphopantetheinyl transferase